MAQAQKDDFESDDFEADDFTPDKSEKPSIFIKEESNQPKSLMQRLADPLLLEADLSGPESLLKGGMNVGESVPGLNKIWPGGIHIPGLGEMYNELIRPMSSPIGLGLMGLEGAINRFGANRGSSVGSEGEQPLQKLSSDIALPKKEPKLLGPATTNLESTVGIPTGELPLKQPQLPAVSGEERLNTGRPAELLHPNRMEPASEIIPIESLDDKIAKEPAKTVVEEVLPKPGSFKDVGPIRAAVGSVNQTLESRDITKPIANTLTTAQDMKDNWRGTTHRELSELSQGLNKQDRITLGKLIDGQPIESIINKSSRPSSRQSLSSEIGAIGDLKSDPTATRWKTIVDELDQSGAPDSEYRDILSTGTKNSLKRGETWRSRVLGYIDILNKRFQERIKDETGSLSFGSKPNTNILDLQDRANQARVILDQIHDMFPEGATRSGENVGYLENYFTHIQDQPSDIRSAISDILDHHFGIFKKTEDIKIPTKDQGIGDYFETSTGHPSSPYVEERTGKARDIDYDVNRVFPAYVESAAKVIFDKPAVEKATKMLRDIPDSNLKELATWSIKNYSRYDASKGLHSAWDQWTKSIARTTARSLLGWNTGLQTLHLARVPANLWPELGTKYTYFGLQKIARNPIAAWTEAAKLGLLQGEIKPFSFKTPLEKIDSVSNFFSMADYIDKAAGYYGYKEKFMRSGMPEEQAKLAALKETKRVSQTTDPSRAIPTLTAPQGGNPLGIAAANLGGQFKTVPAKIVEQYMRIASQTKNNPKQAARMLAGIGIVTAANEGLRTFHLDPMHMIPTSIYGAFGDTVARVGKALAKGDWETALKETVLWATPGGKSLERQIKSGPSALQ